MERSAPGRSTVGANGTGTGPSGTAEGVAAFRAVEAMLPEDERICYDPYAVHFTSEARLAWLIKNPNHPFSGLQNTIAARVRYFDEMVKVAARDGLEQLVIMGAGYDTRAYRIDELTRDVRVFEIDHPDTQRVKKEKIRNIFFKLPDHVTYVAVDFETQDFGQRLLECGYSVTKKTLFLMEGLLMYLPGHAIDEMLSFMVHNSGRGSAILFDCSKETAAGDTPDPDIRRAIREHTARQGEPIRFAIPKEGIETFLTEREFSQVRNVTSAEYKRMYFTGKNKDRVLYQPLSFTWAVIR